MIQKNISRQSFHIDDLHDMIMKTNNDLIPKYDRLHPLASGNCGYFAIALSNFLKNQDIEHDIRIFSENAIDRNIEKHEDPIPAICSDLQQRFIPGAHVVVCVDNNVYDFMGKNSIPNLLHYMKKNWYDCNYWHYLIDPDDEGLEEYCSRRTSPWLQVEDFEEYISNNWQQ